MRIGLVARCDNTGLGNQTYEFFKHMKPSKTIVINMSKYNGYAQYPERYFVEDQNTQKVMFLGGIPTPPEIDEFLNDLDVVFIAEAAYNPYLYTRAKELGVKTANQYNWEFFDWQINPHMPRPDLFIAPSKWHYSDIEAWCQQNNLKHTYLHCPIDRQLLRFRRIPKARYFLHTAGKAAAYDRNGTKTVIEASKLIKSNAMIYIHFQGQQGLPHQSTDSIDDYLNFAELYGDMDKLDIITKEFENYADVYDFSDVLLLPRRYGGNCLPMNEALGVGMPVIMSDLSPNNTFLPREWLLPASNIGFFTPRSRVDIYSADPQALAERIDYLYNLSESEMLKENVKAGELGESISWSVMKPKYLAAFEELCQK